MRASLPALLAATLLTSAAAQAAFGEAPAPFPGTRPHPASAQPDGSFWLAAELAADRRGLVGAQPLPGLSLQLRLDEAAARAAADLSWQVLPADGARPGLLLGAYGLGGRDGARGDLVGLGWDWDEVQLGGGIDPSRLRPYGTLRWLPDGLPLALSAEAGRVAGQAGWRLSADWQALPGLALGLGLQDTRSGLTEGASGFLTVTLRADAGTLPRGRPRPPAILPTGPGTATVRLDGETPAAAAIGAAAAAVLPTAANGAVTVDTSMAAGLPGTATVLAAPALEAARRGRGSSDEIGRSARFTPAPPPPAGAALSGSLDLTTETGPGPAPSGWVHRLHADLGTTLELHAPGWGGLLFDAATRVTLDHSLDRLPLPQEHGFNDDTALFAAEQVGPARLRVVWLGRIAPGLHAAASAGLLEEKYGGAGGELLWRPFDARWSLGAEVFGLWRREPGRLLLRPETWTVTGAVRLGYDLPGAPVTASLAAVRFLDGGPGLELGLTRRLGGGAELRADAIVAGGIAPKLSLTVPLGDVTGPLRTRLRVLAREQGRTTGQSPDRETRLETLTAIGNLGRITETWPLTWTALRPPPGSPGK